MSNLLSSVCVAMLALSLVGCVHLSSSQSSSVSLGVNGTSEVADALSESASRIERDYQRLLSLSQESTPAPAYSRPTRGDLVQKMTFQWRGPIEPAVGLLANKLGYSFRIIGTSLPPEPCVFIDAHDKPLFELLEEIGFQAADRAEIELSEKTREVLLRYLPSGGKVK